MGPRYHSRGVRVLMRPCRIPARKQLAANSDPRLRLSAFRPSKVYCPLFNDIGDPADAPRVQVRAFDDRYMKLQVATGRHELPHDGPHLLPAQRTRSAGCRAFRESILWPWTSSLYRSLHRSRGTTCFRRLMQSGGSVDREQGGIVPAAEG